MSLFDGNLAALALRSPGTAARVERLTDDGGFSTSVAADGQAIVLHNGRPLESRRDPVRTAERQASEIADGSITLLGLGAGYLAEAMLDRGRELAAVIDSVAAVAAAMRARDLRRLLARVPVHCVEGLGADSALAALKARAPLLVLHGARVAGDDRLKALAEHWPALAIVTRPPRVLVVGPIYGGSLETARSAARASQAIGAETRLLDVSAFAEGWHAIGRWPFAAGRVTHLQAEFGKVLGAAVEAYAAEWRPDLMLALAQAPLNASVLARLRAAGTVTAFWFVENKRVLPYWQQVAKDYDVFFAIQSEPFLTELRKAGAPKAVYLPTACDATRHVPITLSAEEHRRFGADVSFAGAPYLNRQRLLLGLIDLAPRVWGEGWAGTELAACAAESARWFSQDEMVRVFAATKVNLNIHSANHVGGLDPDADYVNPRTFELAACGAFQLVDARDPLPELFAPDEIATFRSIAGLRESIRHYLDRPDERAAIAERARARALAEHTFEHRMRRILEETLPAHLAAPCSLIVETDLQVGRSDAQSVGPNPIGRSDADPFERRGRPSGRPLDQSQTGRPEGRPLRMGVTREARATTLDDTLATLALAPHMTNDEAMLRILQRVRDVNP